MFCVYLHVSWSLDFLKVNKYLRLYTDIFLPEKSKDRFGEKRAISHIFEKEKLPKVS